MIQVYAYDDFEKTISIFKERVDYDGILKETKVRRFYLTRSQRRRVKDIEAGKRRRRRERNR